MDEYFRRHDGQAVTCDDFVAAMAAASGFDFAPFMRWYNQPGTPHVAVERPFRRKNQRYTLTCTQSNARASDDQPYLIPIRVALFDATGNHRRHRANAAPREPRSSSTSTASPPNRSPRCCATSRRRSSRLSPTRRNN
jgi:aminopeptidase N